MRGAVVQERVIYNKEVQTMDIESESSESDDDDALDRAQREREALEAEQAAREKQLEEESVLLDKEIEQVIRGSCSGFMGLAAHNVQLSGFCRDDGGGEDEHLHGARIP